MYSATADTKIQTLARQYLKSDFSYFNLHQYELANTSLTTDSSNPDQKDLIPLKINHYYMNLPIE